MRVSSFLASLLLLCACSDDAPVDPGPPRWQVALDESALDRVALSSWGAAADRVFFVGGALGNGGPALALSYDGSAFHDLAPGGDDSFWWVSGTSATDVWMVGEQGRLTHYDGSAFEEHDSGTTATLWGVWPFSPSDVWVVGGSPGMGTGAPNDIVMHYDGDAWATETLPGTPLGRSLYKVWGTSSENLYVVGEAGTIWHREGSSWTLESEPPVAQGTLFTVYGCSASEIYAVGGRDVLRTSGDGAWTQAIDPLDLNSGVNGVSCAAPGQVALAGFGGLKQRLVDGTWIDEFTIEPYADLHATWMGGPEEIWVVGGDFQNPPSAGEPRPGVIARYGRGDVPHAIE